MVLGKSEQLLTFKPSRVRNKVGLQAYGDFITVPDTADTKLARGSGRKLLWEDQPPLALYDFIFDVYVEKGIFFQVLLNFN